MSIDSFQVPCPHCKMLFDSHRSWNRSKILINNHIIAKHPDELTYELYDGGTTNGPIPVKQEGNRS